MKSLNSAKKILAALVLAACAVFAQAAKPVAADSAKAMDTAAVHAKSKMKEKAVKPASEPAKAVDSAKAPAPVKGATIHGNACDELKAKIAANIESKGIKGAVVTVVSKEEAGKSGKIVGSCEGGSKKIVYTKG
jgi:hypothetical protein